MFIHFKTDNTVTLPGFEAEITFEEKGKLFLRRWNTVKYKKTEIFLHVNVAMSYKLLVCESLKNGLQQFILCNNRSGR